jgi:hypothetical protein
VLIANVNAWVSAYLEAGSADRGENHVNEFSVNQIYFLLGNAVYLCMDLSAIKILISEISLW